MSRAPRSIRYSDEEWDHLEEMAKRERMQRGKFVREASLSGLHGQRGRRVRDGMLGELSVIVGQLDGLRDELAAEGCEAVDEVMLGRLLDKVNATLDELGAFRKVETGHEPVDEDLSFQEPS